MKKILLLFALLFQSTIFATNGRTVGAEGAPLPSGDSGGGVDGRTPGGMGPHPGGGGLDAHSPGTGPRFPIDTNKVVLVITAALIAGAGAARVQKNKLRKV